MSTTSCLKIPVGPGYQVAFAERIKQETGIKTAAGGLITSAEQADAILTNNQANLVVLAHEFWRDPYFPLHAAQVLGNVVRWPIQYEWAKPH